MQYDTDFLEASKLDDSALDEFLKTLAAHHGVELGEIQSEFAMWQQERDTKKTAPWDIWLARVNGIPEGDHDAARSLLDELAQLEPDALRQRVGLETLCTRLNWAKTDCLKALKPEFTAAKKRRADERRKAKMAEKRARRAADSQPPRTDFLNWHLTPFDDHVADVKLLLVQKNADAPKLFQSGTDLVTLHTDSKTGLKQIVACETECMRAILSGIANWAKIGPSADVDSSFADGADFVPHYFPCPRDVANNLLNVEASSLGLPELYGLKHAPFFDSEGNLVVEPGYHSRSGYYYSPSKGLEVPPVSQVPTEEEVRRAKHLLMYEAYGDFPFNDGEEFPAGWHDTQAAEIKLSVGKASRANQIAKTLQPFAEQMIPGFLPLHAVDKPAPRTGSQFLAMVVGIIASGEPAGVRPAPKTDEEWQKSILTAVCHGRFYLIFDNIKTEIESDALASALTSDTVSGRDLGRSREISGRNRGITEVNGNNLVFDTDIAHRTLLVRLDAQLKDPTTRKSFRHPSLSAWCRENRAELVWACLTIIQNWIARGKPEMSDRNRWLAGFEEYCRIMGGILEAAGIQHFNSNRNLINTKADLGEMNGFVCEWLSVFGTEEVNPGTCERDAWPNPARRAYAKATTLVELLLDLSNEIGLGLFDNPNRSSLGSRLSRYLGKDCDRIFEIGGSEYALKRRQLNGAFVYRLAPMNGACERARLKPGTLRPGFDLDSADLI